MTAVSDPLPAHRHTDASRRACLAVLDAISAQRPLTWAEGVAWSELDLARRRSRRARALRLPGLIGTTRRRVAGLERRLVEGEIRKAAVDKARARLARLEREAAELARG